MRNPREGDKHAFSSCSKSICFAPAKARLTGSASAIAVNNGIILIHDMTGHRLHVDVGDGEQYSS